MAKIRLNGETFDYDGTKTPVSEALAIEEAYGRRYVQWQDDMAAGGAKAMCVLAQVIWRREGREVPDLQDMLSDEAEFDLNDMIASLVEAGIQDAIAAQAQEKPDPTIPGASSDPDGTPTTGTATPRRSRGSTA